MSVKNPLKGTLGRVVRKAFCLPTRKREPDCEIGGVPYVAGTLEELIGKGTLNGTKRDLLSFVSKNNPDKLQGEITTIQKCFGELVEELTRPGIIEPEPQRVESDLEFLRGIQKDVEYAQSLLEIGDWEESTSKREARVS